MDNFLPYNSPITPAFSPISNKVLIMHSTVDHGVHHGCGYNIKSLLVLILIILLGCCENIHMTIFI